MSEKTVLTIRSINNSIGIGFIIFNINETALKVGQFLQIIRINLHAVNIKHGHVLLLGNTRAESNQIINNPTK